MKIKLVKSNLLNKFLFKLRNSFEIRKASKNKKKISFKEHTKWFFQFKKNKNNKIYIIILNSEKIGYIRTTKSSKDHLVSIAIKKNLLK